MLSGSDLPTSLAMLLASFQTLFTAPTFATFSALVGGFIAQVGEHNVCGMLTGAGLAQRWHHSRAHRFLSNRRWSVDQMGLCLAALIVERLVPAGAPHRTGCRRHAIPPHRAQGLRGSLVPRWLRCRKVGNRLRQLFRGSWHRRRAPVLHSAGLPPGCVLDLGTRLQGCHRPALGLFAVREVFRSDD